MDDRRYPDRPSIGGGAMVLEAAFYPLGALDGLAPTPGTGPMINKAFDLKNKVFS
jgi:hypothetical protein